MGTAAVGMVAVRDAIRWDAAGVKRAAKRQVSRHDAAVRFPRSDYAMAMGAAGKGFVWEENGRTMRAQCWAPTAYKGVWWYLVYAGCAYFPGEMRMVGVAPEGHAWLHQQHSYNPRGDRAHRHDGSACFGAMSYAHGGCPGCAAEREALDRHAVAA
jgi:hypothetical protein